MSACRHACLLLLGFLALAYAAKNHDSGSDWLSELRRVPQPTLDATGKFQTFRKHFVRSDPETGEYTRLKYECTRPVDHFVDLNSPAFGVKNIGCSSDKLVIETSTKEGSAALRTALVGSSSGLSLAGEQWGCRSNVTGAVAQAFRSFWTPTWDSTTVSGQHVTLDDSAGKSATRVVVLETQDASPFTFLHEASISFHTNHSVLIEENRRSFGAFGDNLAVNFDFATGAPIKSSIPVMSTSQATMSCENCYVHTKRSSVKDAEGRYLVSGMGLDVEVNFYTPTYIRAWYNGSFVVSADVKAEVRRLSNCHTHGKKTVFKNFCDLNFVTIFVIHDTKHTWVCQHVSTRS
jgi:hypothetical protein